MTDRIEALTNEINKVSANLAIATAKNLTKDLTKVLNDDSTDPHELPMILRKYAEGLSIVASYADSTLNTSPNDPVGIDSSPPDDGVGMVINTSRVDLSTLSFD